LIMDRRTETIELGKGVEYAKVAARLAEFHADQQSCSIETSCEFKEGWALFRAVVTTKRGTFSGHSMGKVTGKIKQFEKQETIAVGRALAFAGYLASGEIASFEEMADFERKEPEVSLASLNDLKSLWATKSPADGRTREQHAQAFLEWALAITVKPLTLDHRDWTREDVDICLNSLKNEVKDGRDTRTDG
jgi:hypothetical protein